MEGNLGSVGPSSLQNSFSTAGSLVCSAKDNTNKGGSLRGTVGSLVGCTSLVGECRVCYAKQKCKRQGWFGYITIYNDRIAMGVCLLHKEKLRCVQHISFAGRLCPQRQGLVFV